MQRLEGVRAVEGMIVICLRLLVAPCLSSSRQSIIQGWPRGPGGWGGMISGVDLSRVWKPAPLSEVTIAACFPRLAARPASNIQHPNNVIRTIVELQKTLHSHELVGLLVTRGHRIAAAECSRYFPSGETGLFIR